ncbi:gastrula zinc finger protein XlCGF46.1 [Drosophila virilis]|uniref:Uncharacterized protein, isoform A n=1 Tax=Drosophila virilis TaxID=7244 RepID=B4LIA4_DROVI|nr:gastrula zinc finger protein XlCGF46.1 [Drosophila virilis]EDW69671.2 uncharacterized protein Dvir_GJ11988, isoform A [Drosophila virilis]
MTTFTKCRVCICDLDATVGSYDMRKLPLLAHKFVTCTDLSVSEEQRVPSELCQACYNQLEQLYAFRAKCIAADTKWRMQILAFCDEEEPIYDLEAAPSTVAVEELKESNKKQNGKLHEKNEKCEEHQLDSVEVEIENHDMETPAQPMEDNVESDAVTSSSPRHPKSVFKCDICAAQFLNEKRLLAHSRRHGQMPYPCPEPGCDRGYSHKHTLSLHMRKCHKLGKEHKSHVCEFCGKLFDTMALLKNHRFTHKDKLEQPFACEEPDCERRFATKQLLKIHMMRHAGIKNYTCSYCGVQKTTRTELKIHLNYHTLERTYCCRLCSKVCYSSSNLNKHMRTVHERARNYACRYCERAFIQPETRNQHELIHTGEKPHGCVECGRHFRQKAALRAHYKIHTRQLKEQSSELGTDTHEIVGDEDGNDMPETEYVEYD